MCAMHAYLYLAGPISDRIDSLGIHRMSKIVTIQFGGCFVLLYRCDRSNSGTFYCISVIEATADIFRKSLRQDNSLGFGIIPSQRIHNYSA